MSGFPPLSGRTGRLSAPTWQYHRSSSGSPVRHRHFQQQHVDDLLSGLSPATALQILRFPSGSLKACLDSASTSEHSFAMRAALAANSIQKWLDELSEWPWPAAGGSTGFEEPTKNRRILKALTARTKSLTLAPSDPVIPEKQITHPVVLRAAGSSSNDASSSDPTPLWIGSLAAADVTRYDARVSEIRREMANLELEELKQHVLHHHILPLTPPGTPSFDGAVRRASSASTTGFVKMDDLTAVVTAIVVQTLPLLSRLVQLLDIWHIRLLVLQKTPAFLKSIGAAEDAIDSAWEAVHIHRRPADAADSPSSSSDAPTEQDLRPDNFSVIKSLVERKVSRAAQLADYMLDVLDGWEDTLPDDWVKRIDAVEHAYGEWVAVCERKMREPEWCKAKPEKPALPQETPAPAAATVASPTASVAASFMPATPEEDGSESSSDKTTGQLPEIQVPVNGYHTPPNLTPQSSSESLRLGPSLPIVRRGSSSSASSSASPPPSSGSDSYRDIPVLGLPANIQTFGARRAARGADQESSPEFRGSARSAVVFNDMPTVNEIPGEDGHEVPPSPTELSFLSNVDDDDLSQYMAAPSSSNKRRTSFGSDDDQLQHQISEILESIPAKIRLSSQPAPLNHLNPPDFKMPRKPKVPSDGVRSTSSMSSRSMTPSFLLAPAYTRNPRPRQQRGSQEIKLYHLSRSTGEAPIKLFIRLVGENGERVMVRVGGGWADLSEYLKEYASHHSRRSKSGCDSKVEVRDVIPAAPASPYAPSKVGSSPPSRPASSLGSPMTLSPLAVPKTRKTVGEDGGRMARPTSALARITDTPSSVGSTTRSRSSSYVSWAEEENTTLGMSGPRTKNVEMSEENKAWVESIKERVRIASSERRIPEQPDKFGEMGKAGGTKRLFRKAV